MNKTKAALCYVILSVTVVLTAFFILGNVAVSSTLESVRFDFGETEDFGDDWRLTSEKQVSDDETFKFARGRLTVSREVPAMDGHDKILFFKNERNKVTVTLDGECIYRYGESGMLWGKALPSVYCFVPLDAQSEGKLLEISLENKGGGQLLVPELRTGRSGAVLYFILQSYAGLLCFCTMMFGFSLVLIGGAVFLVLAKKPYGLFLHAGTFILLTSVWILTDSPILQLLSGSSEFVFLLSFTTFMLFALPMISFIECICGKRYKGFEVMRILFLVNYVVQMFLYSAAGIDLYYMVILTHFLIIAVIICIIRYLLKEYKRYRAFYAKGILAAIFIFLVTTALSYANYYAGGYDYNVYMRLGMLTFSLILTALSFKKMLLAEEESAKAVIYESLACLDIMTGCKNRNAFEADLEKLFANRKKNSHIRLGIVDLDGLKKINDTQGHSAGDEAIAGAAGCIRDAFRGRWEVYRIGGDEFASLLSDSTEPELLLKQWLHESVTAYNADSRIPVALSCGFSCCGPEDGRLGPKELYHEADRRMYMEKKESPDRRKD